MSKEFANVVPVFKQKYHEEIKENLKKVFGFTNDMAVPKIQKIVLSIGAGSEIDVKKAMAILDIISAQTSVVRKARKSIAAFKIREGAENGAMVTCRGDRMYYTLQRLMLALLNWRGFQLLSPNSINVAGSVSQITVGIPDCTVVQGIQADTSTKNIGFSFTIVTNARKKEHLMELLRGFGFEFNEGGKNVRKK